MPTDLELLQGAWSVTSLEMDGHRMPDAMMAGASIVIRGNRFTTSGMGADYSGSLELDAAASPGRVAMKFDAGPEKGNVNHGIYEVEGETLRLCLATRGGAAPATFSAPAGTGYALEVLSRKPVRSAEKPQRGQKPEAPAAPGNVPELEGEWRMVSAVFDGEPLDESNVKWVKRVTTANETSVLAGPQVMMRARYITDKSLSPGGIDYVNLAGPHKGKEQVGIFDFQGDLLRICMAAPGSPRPDSFRSDPGDGRAFTVWRRA